MSFDEETENFVSQKEVHALEDSYHFLKNEKAELLKDREKLTTQNTELAEKIKVLAIERDKLIASHQEKADLDLHNRSLSSANQDLKRQNRKLEEENIALKERAYGLNEQLFTLQPQKPQ
ncbi:hypothetical protein ACOWMB_00245 [Helicobacter pylori]